MNNTKTMSDLKNERTALWEQAKAFIERNKDEDTGMVPPEAVRKFDEMTDMIRRYDGEIRLREEIAETDRRLGGEGSDYAEKDAGVHAEMPEKKASAMASDTYRNAFWNMLRGEGNILEVRDALSIGVDVEGGYTVPDEFEKKLVKGLEDHNVLRTMAKVIRTQSGTKKIPVATSMPEAEWFNEGDQIPETEAHFDRVTLSSYKIGTMLKASNEFLHDTFFSLDDYLADCFGEAIGKCEEDSFINGTGKGMPTGLLHDVYGAETGAVTEMAGEVGFDDIINLYYSLPSSYRKRAAFLCNEDLLRQLRLLKDGHGQYIWKSSVEAGMPDTLFGKPIFTSAFMPELREGNKVMLWGDFSYYWIADRGKRTFRRLDEVYALSDHVGFFSTQRVDGKLILPEAMKALRVKA